MKIIKNITVLMGDSSNSSTTYPKRATQLVKNNRAYWVDTTTISMKAQREDIDMAKQDKNIAKVNTENAIAKTEEIIEVNQPEDTTLNLDTLPAEPSNTKALYEATKRVEEKNRIIFDFINLIILGLYGLTMVFSQDAGVRATLTFFFLLLYLVKLLLKANKYLKTSSTRKIKEYLEDRKEREIRIAYEKILESEIA